MNALPCPIGAASALAGRSASALFVFGSLLAGPGSAAAQPPAATEPAVLPPVIVEGRSTATLTVPSVEDARSLIELVPGAAEVVSDAAWRDTPADTLKDMLEYSAGVFVQPKWGEDSRLSIRGSGLSRYYHLRGVSLYQDGVPLNNADGSSDFQSIDPTAYRYTEVYKGANGLRYGSGTLGGAINFVTPSGRDADRLAARVDIGSFGWRRLQLAGGRAHQQADFFATASALRRDGFREHSAGHSQRASANMGLRLAARAETRFYLSGQRVRQEIPGSLTREQAVQAPRRAASANLVNRWQRNSEGARIANRTVMVAGDTIYEFGGWYSRSSLDHPIYQYLDNDYRDYGLYGRAENTASLAGHQNRYVIGLTWSAGTVDARNFVNTMGRKGAPVSRTRDRSDNIILYGENAFDIVPGISLVAGAQYLHAERARADRYNGGLPATRSGSRTYQFLNPKLGLLWQLDARVQVYANVSRSAEPPTFGDMNFSTADDLARLRPQRATTVEIGTRGRHGTVQWDVSAYQARVRHEFQCAAGFTLCDSTINLDRTVHRGIEAGASWRFAEDALAGVRPGAAFVLRSAYTLSDFRFDGDPRWENKQLPGVPRHLLRTELLYRDAAGFFAGPNLEWVPQASFVDNANSMKTESYALLGLRVGREGERWSVFVEARNLANRRYIASASTTDQARPDLALFEPGNGRSVHAGVQLRY